MTRPSFLNYRAEFAKSPLARLRAVTHHLHEALHSHPVAAAILNQGRSDALVHFLAVQHHLLMTIRASIPKERLGQIRPLLTALVEDLEPELEPHDTQPLGKAKRAGYCYVAIGSLQGRRALSIAMRRHGFDSFPNSYLTVPFPKELWCWVLDELKACAENDTVWAQVELAALDAFENVAQLLDDRSLRDAHNVECKNRTGTFAHQIVHRQPPQISPELQTRSIIS